MICVDCGNPFELVTRRGKPRRKCYDCNPLRPKQGSKRATQPVAPPKPQTLADVKANPHCPFCGAYPSAKSAAFPFCSPQHRQFLATRVQQAAADQRRRNGRLTANDDSNRKRVAA